MPTVAESRVFPCNHCGACCRNLGNSPLYAQLDRGDGICCHLNTSNNLCGIYETRPEICRVADMFSAFEGHLTWPEYVDLNQRCCDALRMQTSDPKPPTT